MSWVFIAYGLAALAALIILWLYQPAKWYWHILAIVAAFGIGLIPTPEPFRADNIRRYADAVVGTIFVFLIFWGLAAPLFRHKARA